MMTLFGALKDITSELTYLISCINEIEKSDSL
jgi:hypothetical protein